MSIISPSGLSGDYYYITILVIVLVLFYWLGFCSRRGWGREDILVSLWVTCCQQGEECIVQRYDHSTDILPIIDPTVTDTENSKFLLMEIKYFISIYKKYASITPLSQLQNFLKADFLLRVKVLFLLYLL